MAVSVRMEPLLEKELELAAKRRGVTKSQFIIEAVQRALGQRNPGAIYNLVMEEMPSYPTGKTSAPEDHSPLKQAVKARLRAKHLEGQAEYAAHLKKAASRGGKP